MYIQKSIGLVQGTWGHSVHLGPQHRRGVAHGSSRGAPSGVGVTASHQALCLSQAGGGKAQACGVAGAVGVSSSVEVGYSRMCAGHGAAPATSMQVQLTCCQWEENITQPGGNFLFNVEIFKTPPVRF